MQNFTPAQTEAAITSVLACETRTYLGFASVEEMFAAQEDDVTIGSTFDPDRGHCQRYLRTVAPWDLVCEFFHWNGKCADLLTRADFLRIGSIASGFETDSDWSFIRDCDDQQREALYLSLCLTIRTKRLASKTYRAINGVN